MGSLRQATSLIRLFLTPLIEIIYFPKVIQNCYHHTSYPLKHCRLRTMKILIAAFIVNQTRFFTDSVGKPFRPKIFGDSPGTVYAFCHLQRVFPPNVL